MEHHIDRRVVLSQDSEFKNLYKWSLNELDAEGNKAGRDQIPWNWSLYFTASELVLSDIITIEPGHQDDSKDRRKAVHERQFIRAKLYPGRPGDQDIYRQTSYSMFGTNRTISSFELYIEKLEDGDEQERCKAWGSVSYTAEIEFRDETSDDCVIFYLHVRSETFARYAEKISTSAVDEVVLRVGEVSGFYSDWSPSISTEEIKVLTDNEEHKVEIPSDCKIIPPRLGEVIQAELYLYRVGQLERARLEISEEPKDWNTETLEEPSDSLSSAQLIRKMADLDDRFVSILSSVRVVLWFIAGLLVLILIT